MVGLTFRTYRINALLDVVELENASRGYLPGTRKDKAGAFFASTRACEILDQIGIPYVIGGDGHLTDEAIFAMDEEQQSLWRCASGDRYCAAESDHQGDSLMGWERVAARLADHLSDWRVAPADAMLNFQRGNTVVSLYPDLNIRALTWPNPPRYGFIHVSSLERTIERFLTNVL
ncbi:MAG: hypothetical protein EOO77_31125 [Oxalobacteraceae bacterium]|nr:MAG: hypothetical protein EOO77_31125 [Oxalobacteraceae bacterium]